MPAQSPLGDRVLAVKMVDAFQSRFCTVRVSVRFGAGPANAFSISFFSTAPSLVGRMSSQAAASEQVQTPEEEEEEEDRGQRTPCCSHVVMIAFVLLPFTQVWLLGMRTAGN
ncbi:hypothetical protein Mapa_007174 [Marchantia paleacea]|nr:hypothetical protein Mapa_007174 [Marchantia paleacea]